LAGRACSRRSCHDISPQSLRQPSRTAAPLSAASLPFQRLQAKWRRLKMNVNTIQSIRLGLDAVCGGSALRFIPRSQSLQKIVAIVALSLATVGCSVTQNRDGPSPAASAERTPLSAIETAFAALSDTAAVNEAKAQGSCNDLEFSFLNVTCSKKHRKRASLKHHRVATFIIGRTDAITSSLKSPAQSARASQEAPADSGGSGKTENPKTACAQSWPYYERTCMLKQTGVVRVIALDRQTPVR
jgi:hypothetical protein